MTTFTVVVEVAGSRELGIPIYSPVEPTHVPDVDTAVHMAYACSAPETHVRVVVDGCDYDVADFGPRPDRYCAASMTARVQRGLGPSSRGRGTGP